MRKSITVAVLSLALSLALAASPALAWEWPLGEPPASLPPATVAVKPAALAPQATFTKVEGPDRIATAIAASKLAFPGTADTIVLCTGWNWPDALGGAALAGAHGGPLLLTRPDALSSAVVTEAVRLDARNVVIIGSPSAVSTGVADALAAATVNGRKLNVTRIGGVNRYDTSAQVASATVARLRASGRTYDGTALFSTGRNFPDALAASPIAAKKGWPVLLAEPSAPTSWTESAIASLTVTRGIVLGSEKAVTKPVADRLTQLLPAPPTRIAGADRYLTALEIARFAASAEVGLGFNGVALATGENFPDALAGGVMQGKLGSVVLLTPSSYLNKAVFDELAGRRAGIAGAKYLGSTSVLKTYTREGVAAALAGQAYPTRNGMIFPVAGDCSYSDTFGAPRSGGRTHEGTDIMAARNTPVVACLNGTVTTRTNTLGGNCVYIDADNGWRFYYAHLERWAVASGTHVQAGQVVGYVGNSGNASGGATHLHIQMWTPAGALVNPYPYLRQMIR